MNAILFVFASLALGVSPGDPLSASGGRFVLGQISEYRRDQFLLDTQTGRVWQMIMNQDSALVFTPVFFSASPKKVDGEWNRVYVETPPKPDSVIIPMPKN